MIPVLYSFRRCPFAIRARLAIAAAGLQVELREVLLRDKAPEFLDTSASGTVPCLKTVNTVLDESLDIMLWALDQDDQGGWLEMPSAGHQLIVQADGPFKQALDRYKYANRYENVDAEEQRSQGASFIHELNDQIREGWLFNGRPSLADMAILPFVRQFAFTDKQWFDEQDWPAVHEWLQNFLISARFVDVMQKYPVWTAGDPITTFGASKQPTD
jgi:glutathione S-transferase